MKSNRRLIVVRFAALIFAVAATAPISARPVQVVQSQTGIVATADPLATAAGIRMLEKGGNAIDAAVAAGLALSVVEPSMSGIGGRAVLLLRLPDGTFHGIDGMSQVPDGYEPDDDAEYGYRTIGVPGAIAAYAEALEEFGSLSFEDVIAPAIELAENGFFLPFSTTDDALTEFVGTREVFRRKDGSGYRFGERFRQPALAQTLEQIGREGPEAFYTGKIAEAMARDIQAHGGFVTTADLASYDARRLRIVRGDYRGYELVGTGSPPSGYMLIEALHILENFDLAAADEAVWGLRVCQALQTARIDRDNLPEPAAEREAKMVSKHFAAERARTLLDTGIARGGLATDDEPGHTSHISVVDGDGMVVSMTQSLGPEFGSRVATPGLGFLYAVTMGSYKDGRPGTRPQLSQSPFMVLRDGEPVLVLGAAGGGRIPSAIVSVVSRLIDRGESFTAAVSGPRVHSGEVCPRLETTGTLEFRGALSRGKFEGAFHSGFGDTYPFSGAHRGSERQPAGTWSLTPEGLTTHPYSEIGARLELVIESSEAGWRALLRNGADPHDGQPELGAWHASSVSLENGRLNIQFPARIAWSEADYLQLVEMGFKAQTDQPVARVHALYYDATQAIWTGMADPRGRGSAGRPQVTRKKL